MIGGGRWGEKAGVSRLSRDYIYQHEKSGGRRLFFFPSHDKNVSSGGILSARRCLRTRFFFCMALALLKDFYFLRVNIFIGNCFNFFLVHLSRRLFWNSWTDFNKTWQEVRFNVLYQVCVFLGRSEKQDGRCGLWLAEKFSTSALKPLNRIQRNLTGRKISTSSTKFVFFGSIGKTRWPPLLLIGWDIFDFSSETAEWNLMKLDRKQDLNFLYKVCVFPADRKTENQDFLFYGLGFAKRLLFFESKYLYRKLFQFLLVHLSRRLFWNSWTDFNKTWQEARFNVLYQVCVFWADRKNRMAAVASDWLRNFRLLLLNRWTEFNETWQEERSQRPLPSLCFLGRSEKQDGHPCFWLAETFSTSPLKLLNGIWWNLTGSKIWTSSTKFVFFRPIGKLRTRIFYFMALALLKDFYFLRVNIFIGNCFNSFLVHLSRRLFWNSWTDFNKTWQEARFNVLYQVCVFWADRKNRMAAVASDWLRNFRLLLLNRWTEFNETWQEERSQRPLPSLCFLGRSEKQDGHPCFWLAETFSTSPLKLLNGIWWNLTGSKISTSSTKFVFFRPIGKLRTRIFYYMALALLKDFYFLRVNIFIRNCFNFFLVHLSRRLFWNSWTDFNKTWQEARFNVFYQVCVFWADRKNRMAVVASDWLRNFRLLL